MNNFFTRPLNAFLTGIALPVALYLLKLLKEELKTGIAYVLNGVLAKIRPILKQSVAAELSLKDYCRLQLAGVSRYLNVPSVSDITLNVDQVYVRLVVAGSGEIGQQYDHTNVLSSGNRIRVIGDPGSGKSSLVKRLFRDACSDALRRPRVSRFPIFLELRTLTIPPDIAADKLGHWFYEHLRQRTETVAAYQIGDCFDVYAQRNGLLVLLDGLDEVSGSAYPRVEQSIIGLSRYLASRGEENILFLTMRTQFHSQIRHAFTEDFPPVLSLRPFSPSDIYDFLTLWPFPKDVSRKRITKIYQDLTDRPTLRELCTNPLVLAMYVAESQLRDGPFAPESRTDFYSRVTTELLIRRRLQQTGVGPGASTLRRQREQILGRLAYDHITDPTQPPNSLNWSEALRITIEVTKCAPEEAELLFWELAKETGIVSEERARETFRFIHLTFCEFFAAFEAVRGEFDRWTALVELHSEFSSASAPQLRSRLLEVIPFACALLVPRQRQQEGIATIHALGDSRLLARCFLETKLYEHQLWPLFVTREHDAILAVPEEQWGDVWLRDLHVFNVIVRDASFSATHIRQGTSVDLGLFYRSLLSRQQNSLATLLSAFAATDAAAAFNLAELSGINLAAQFPAIVLKNCDQAPFYALIREKATESDHDATVWRNLLAESSLRSSVVAQWLRTEPDDLWRSASLAVPVERRWFNRGLLPDSALTRCLSLAIQSSDDTPQAILINTLTGVPAPGSKHFLAFWLRNEIRVWICCSLIGALLIGGSVLDEGMTKVFSAASFGAFGSFYAVFFATLPFSLRANMWRQMYFDIINQVRGIRLEEIESTPVGRLYVFMLGRRRFERTQNPRQRIERILLDPKGFRDRIFLPDNLRGPMGVFILHRRQGTEISQD